MSDPQWPPAGPTGGSIERTLDGRAELEIGAVLREAWQLTDGVKTPIVGGLLLMYGVLFAVTMLVETLFAVEEQSYLEGALIQLATMMIIYPFMAGVFMFGLRHSVGEPVAFKDQFGYYGEVLPIVAVGALQSLVTFAGLLLFVVPGIYLMFALSLAIPLRVERGLPINDCLFMSLRLVNRKFFEVTVLTLAGLALTVIGFVSVVGWIWTVPWTLMIFSLIYRQLAGYQRAGDPPANPGRLEL